MMAVARGYRVPLIDYCREGDGLLVSSGCGVMLAVMDNARTIRWCLDIDGMKDKAALAAWLPAAERIARRVYVCG